MPAARCPSRNAASAHSIHAGSDARSCSANGFSRATPLTVANSGSITARNTIAPPTGPKNTIEAISCAAADAATGQMPLCA